MNDTKLRYWNQLAYAFVLAGRDLVAEWERIEGERQEIVASENEPYPFPLSFPEMLDAFMDYADHAQVFVSA